MKKPTDIASYVEEITGVRPVVRDLRDDEVRAVPLFLRTLYRLSVVEMFTRRIVLAMDEEPGEATPRGYAQHVELLRSAMDTDVVLGLRGIAARVRNRLDRQRVPFIVPDRQMFMPFLALDLRERARRRPTPPREVLTPASHALVLYHLFRPFRRSISPSRSSGARNTR